MDWLDWLFQGAGLFESGIWFIGGLIMCLIGIALGWEAVSYRWRAYRVDVCILGVLPNTENKQIRRAFHPIYEFTTRDGEAIVMKSGSAGRLAQNLPNTRRTFLVDPENKYDLRNIWPSQIVWSLVLFLVGLQLFVIASVSGRGLMWAAVVAVVLILVWIMKNFLTPDENLTTESPQPVMKKKRSSRWVQAVVREPDKFDSAKILSEREHWQEILRADRSTLLWMPLWLALGLFALGFGGYRGYQRANLTINGERTPGRVVRTETAEGSETDSYYTVVKFKDAQGKAFEVRDTIGSSSALDKRGDELDVLYDPAEPAQALLDRGFWSWLLPGGFTMLGLGVICGYGKFLLGFFRRRRVGKQILAADQVA